MDKGLSNEGGVYRFDQGVDCELSPTLNDYNVGWMEPVEWLKYSVNVDIAEETDTFRIVLSAGSGLSAGGVMRIDFSNNNITTGNFNIPSTGGWHVYNNVVFNNVILNKGLQKMTVNVISGGYNLYKITIIEQPVVPTNIHVESELAHINVYPNPVINRELFIQAPQLKNSQIQIFDMYGKLILNTNLSNTGEANISFPSGLTSGLYVLKLIDNHQIYTRKFIMQ